jgi:hypothetical protein
MPGLVMTRFQNGRSGDPGFRFCHMTKSRVFVIKALSLFIVILSTIGSLVAEAKEYPIVEEPINVYYAGEVAISVPANLTNIKYNIFINSNNSPIWLMEYFFKDGVQGDIYFLDCFKKSLKLKQKNLHSLTKEESVHDYFGRPSFLTTTSPNPKPVEQADSDAEPDPRRFISTDIIKFELWVKFEAGYIILTNNCYINKQILGSHAQIESHTDDEKILFMSWAKEFLLHYHWTGREIIAGGDKFKTKFGFIDMKDHKYDPRFEVSIQIENKRNASTYMTIGTSEGHIQDTTVAAIFNRKWRYYHANGYLYVPIIRPLKVADKDGFEIINLSNDGIVNKEMIWIESLGQTSSFIRPMVIEMPIYILGRDDAPNYTLLMSIWRSILNNIQPLPASGFAEH